MVDVCGGCCIKTVEVELLKKIVPRFFCIKSEEMVDSISIDVTN